MEYKTCPNPNCRNNGTEFDFEINYCEHCGTELVITTNEEDEEDA
jgi:hypothetical protein